MFPIYRNAFVTLCKPSKLSVCSIKLWCKGAELTTKKTEIKFLPWLYSRKHMLEKQYTHKYLCTWYRYLCTWYNRHRFLAKNLSAKCCLNENEYWGLETVTIRNFSFIHSANIYLVLCCAGNMVFFSLEFIPQGGYSPTSKYMISIKNKPLCSKCYQNYLAM